MSSSEKSGIMGDESVTSQVKGMKRKIVPEEGSQVEEYSHLQKPHHLIQQHIIPYKRANQSYNLHGSSSVDGSLSRRRKKKRHKGSADVEYHPYNISLFDATLDVATPSKKKGKKVQSSDYYEVLRWEKELICENVDALKAMFEFKQIHFFIHKKKKILNFTDVPLYIVERMFLMPRESTHLASVMTALLNHCFHLRSYSPEAPMPYKLWNSYLKMKVSKWYDIVASFGGDTLAATNYIGFEHDFFVVLGPSNPLKFCDFHRLNLLQRVWLVKSLCDSLTLDVEEASEEESDDEDGEHFDCPWLGTDRHGHYYFYLSYYKRQENLRVYRLYKYFFPVAGSFYDRIQHSNHGQVTPCKKYHKLVADDIQSLRRLASKFAEPLETEEASSQMEICVRSARPDCESKLHQQLLDLLAEMEPLESQLKSSTLKMLMLLKSDWDRYHGIGSSAVNEYNCENNDTVRNSHDKRSDYSDDSHRVSPVQHFLVSMVKNEKNVLQLKSIVPHLSSIHEGQKLNLHNICVTPLKKLNNDSQTGVQILTPFESKSECNSMKQIVICDDNVHLNNDAKSEDSDTDDSVLIVEPDITEDNDLDPRAASPLLKENSSLASSLSTHGFSSDKSTDEGIDWETMSDGSSNSFEISVESSNSDASHFSGIFSDVPQPACYGPKQGSSCESGDPENIRELNPRSSKCPVANKHQPLVIRIGSSTDTNAKCTQLSSSGKNQDKNYGQDVQKVDGLPCAVHEHNSDHASSQPNTSALSVQCSTENNLMLSHVFTARKSFSASHRQTNSTSVRENSSAVNHGESALIHENIYSGTDDRFSCSSSVVNFMRLNAEHVKSKSQAPISILKAARTDMGSKDSSRVMKYPIISSSVSLCVMSEGQAHSVTSAKNVASCSKITYLNDASLPKSIRSLVSKSPAAQKTVLIASPPDISFLGRVSEFDNPSLPSVISGEDECSKKALNEAPNVSNRKISVKRFPVSQQLIYTLSPMETSFTIRNSLETCISATKDHLHVCDNGKKIPSQENNFFFKNDTFSSDILSKKITESKNHNASHKKNLNSCRPVLENSSVVVTSVSSNSVTQISGINSEPVKENSGDCLLPSKSENLKKSMGVSLLSHENTTTVISSPEQISKSATGTDVSADFSTETKLNTITGVNMGGTELIPIVLPDGKNILLRLVSSQPASTKTSLQDSSSHDSLLKNSTSQNVDTDLSKKNSNSNSLCESILKSQSTSGTKTTEISQISSFTTSLASSPAREESSLASDIHSEDSESNMKDGKVPNQDSFISLEMVQSCTSNGAIPVSTSVGKMWRRLTYAQKIQEIQKSSESVVSVEKSDDITIEKSVSVAEKSDGDVAVEKSSGGISVVEKSGGVVTVEKTKSTKRKLPLLPKPACVSNSICSSVGMPKVKKVEIPLMANKILNNLSFEGTSPTVSSISSNVISISLCNSVCSPQVATVNSGTIGFTGPVNLAAGNTLNILNTGGTTSGGFIILQGQAQSGNSTFFTQPTTPANQTSLLLMPSVVSTPCVQPFTSPAGYTAPLLSNPVNPALNGIVSSSCIPNSQQLVFLYQNQLYMVPSVIPSNTLPVIAPLPPNSSVSNSANHTGACSASMPAMQLKVNYSANQSGTSAELMLQSPSKVTNSEASTAPVLLSPSKANNSSLYSGASIAPMPPVSSEVNNSTNLSGASVAPMPPSSSEVNNSASYSGAYTAPRPARLSEVNNNSISYSGSSTAPIPLSPSEVNNSINHSEVSIPLVPPKSSEVNNSDSHSGTCTVSICPSLSKVIDSPSHSAASAVSMSSSSSKVKKKYIRPSRATAAGRFTLLKRHMNCKSNKENEAEGGWEVVPDPLELTSLQSENQEGVSGSFKINFFPIKERERKETVVMPNNGQIPEFPGNTEPPVVTSNKKATENYDLYLKLRPFLTLDEPITVIPSRKQDT